MEGNTGEEAFDVLICGGGLAGLTLALQLRRRLPDLRVAVFERDAGPPREACFKVGESLSEIATTYFDRQVGLRDHMLTRQLRKFGLRFFLGDGSGPLEERQEIGLRVLPPFKVFQIDRGRLEGDLRKMARAAGVALREGWSVRDVEISAGDGLHVALVRDPEGALARVHGRWLIDATGRRRLIQRKLGLGVRDNGHHGSAAWFRVPGYLSLAEQVPPAHHAWHGRILEDRWRSTTHLTGRGYWIWLIALASGHTSVGVVIDSDLHPDCEIGPDLAALWPWLERHEPRFAAQLRQLEICDFLALRGFSYGARQVVSANRWACVGEAGVFLDPFYSPGNDYIGISNTIATELIRRDFTDGSVPAELAAAYDQLYLQGLYETSLEVYKGAYETFGAPRVYLVKHFWDSAVYWGVNCQLYLNDLLTHPEVFAELGEVLGRLKRLQHTVQKLFVTWAQATAGRPSDEPRPFERLYTDPSLAPFLQLLVLDLNTRRSPDEALEVMRANLARYEEAAQVIFFAAVADVLPSEALRFERRWVDPYALSLDPARWSRDGLFQPAAAERSLEPVAQALYGGILVPLSPVSWWRRFLMKGFMRLFRGRLFYAITTRVTQAIREGGVRLRRGLFLQEPATPTQSPSHSPPRCLVPECGGLSLAQCSHREELDGLGTPRQRHDHARHPSCDTAIEGSAHS